MNNKMYDLILKELCPNGVWQMSEEMSKVLRRQISRLPRGKVSENETRYPESPVAMRAFLIKFFTRHYFQVQHSLLSYTTSSRFLSFLNSGRFQILDVGCGPAVASLAITDILARILKHLEHFKELPDILSLNYILNDTSSFCLGTGQRMLSDYLRLLRTHRRTKIYGRKISLQNSFPDNLKYLQRIQFNLGTYNIAIFSYVVTPLSEDKGIVKIADGIKRIEKLCCVGGKILVLQDRFKAELLRRISKLLGISINKDELTQYTYPKKAMKETYTYSYYRCLYSPCSKEERFKNAAC